MKNQLVDLSFDPESDGICRLVNCLDSDAMS